MFKPKKEIVSLGSKKKLGTKKEGMAFEQRGTDKYNQTIKFAKQVAQRQIGSGNKHWALGDMITEEALTASLAEFKERGTLSSSGEKQITIKREWLVKLAEEAREMNKEFYFLPFAFKGDSTDYVAMEYDRLLAYIQIIQTMSERMRLLENELQRKEE